VCISFITTCPWFSDIFSDLSGLSLQSSTSRLPKDEYGAGGVGMGGMEMDTELGMPQTIQHHPTAPSNQYTMSNMQSQQQGTVNYSAITTVRTARMSILSALW